MRTTLNLDEDVFHHLSVIARESGRSVSRVSNELLRMGLNARDEHRELPPYEPDVFDTGPPLLDVTDVSEALERLDGV